MKISLIAAMDQNRLIGANNQLPWHLSTDLRQFKHLTLGKPILMGHKTYQSIGKPLPQRRNLVLTRDRTLDLPECECVYSFDEALKQVEDEPELMVIGGCAVYELTLPMATHLYLTRIDASFSGDTYFPAWDTKQWAIVSRQAQTPEKGIAFEFITYERINF